MTTINIKCRNNSDAVRLGNGQIRVPAAESHKHLGRKDVRITTENVPAATRWLDDAYEVDSYDVVSE